MINAMQNTFYPVFPFAVGAAPIMSGSTPITPFGGSGLNDTVSLSPEAMQQTTLLSGGTPAMNGGFLGGMMQSFCLMTLFMKLMELIQKLMGGANSGDMKAFGGAAAAPFTNAGYASPATGSTSGGSGSSSASSVDVSSLNGTDFGREIARDALAHANNEKGLCLKNVGAILRSHGIECGPAPSAYMVADQMADNKEYKEVNVSASELKNLPAGSVVVWDRSGSNPHGHISISLGDGREFSGPIRNQMNLGTSFRVFIPR